MLFQENDCIELPKYNNSFVYFLLKDNEVVYVGQTKVGISRPISHTDKDYDCIKIQYCDIDKLDEVESKYIIKYNPIYNKTYNYVMWYSLERCRNIIRRQTENPKFNIFKLKKLIKEKNIKIYNIMNNKVIYIDDLYKMIEYLRGSYNGTGKTI